MLLKPFRPRLRLVLPSYVRAAPAAWLCQEPFVLFLLQLIWISEKTLEILQPFLSLLRYYSACLELRTVNSMRILEVTTTGPLGLKSLSLSCFEVGGEFLSYFL